MAHLVALLGVVLAFPSWVQAQGTLTLMTYNIKGHAISDTRLANIGKVIAYNQPDVVALQEIDNRDAMGRKKDNMALLAKATGMNAYFHALVGTYYGVGLLSKEKPLAVEYRTWERGENSTDRENRGAIIAEFADYYFISTHYSLNADDRDRATTDIIKFARYADKPVFVAGDFNAAPTYRAMVTFKNNGFKILNDTGQYTYPSNAPTSCIDMVLYFDATQTLCYTVDESGIAPSGGVSVNDASVCSDHLPVFAAISYTSTGIRVPETRPAHISLTATAIANHSAQTVSAAVYTLQGMCVGRYVLTPGQRYILCPALRPGTYMVRAASKQKTVGGVMTTIR